MISVCTTIHHSPKACEAFIRSIYENASGEDFEVRIFSDRCTPHQESLLQNMAASYPRLTVRLQDDHRLLEAADHVPVWREIYGDEIAEYAENQIKIALRNNVDLWLQYAYGLNQMAKSAKGEYLLLTPGDFLVMCDLHKLSKVVEEHATDDGRFFGHFSLVAPFEPEDGWLHDIFLDRSLSTRFHVVNYWLRNHHMPRGDYPVMQPIDRYWPFNHGIRVVDKATFRLVGGLHDEFLSKPGPTNIFNRMARAAVYGPEQAAVRKSIEQQTRFRARMAVVPLDENPHMEYLYENPCDGDLVRKLQYAEEAWIKKKHPELRRLWQP